MDSAQPITQQQAQLIKTSFNASHHQGDEMAEVFYGILFSRKPELRAMFPDDMHEQKNKLNDTINLVVNGCDIFNKLNPELEELGKAHQKLNVKAEDYELVKEILLDALEQEAKEHWTEETKQAWVLVYDAMARIMLTA